MTDRNEIQSLAAKVGAAVRFDSDGRVLRIIWGADSYGDGSLMDIISFAEKARAA